MRTIELITFSVLAVISVMVIVDYLVYTFKSAPKTSVLKMRVWRLGMICIMALVYWFMNGMKFIN